MQQATFTLRRVLSGKTLKQWRKQNNMSAHKLAIELGVSRSYIKSIEGGSLAASQKLTRKFDELRAEWGEGTPRDETPKPIMLISRFELPATLEILSKPRRCKGCRKYFVPVTPNQKIHNCAACHRAARRKRKS